MPNQADTPERPPRRSRRAHKAPGASSSSSQTPSKSQANTSSHDESDTPLAQQTLARQRDSPAVDQGALGHLFPIPSTPTRPHSTQPSSTRKNQMGSESVTGPKNKRDGNQSQNTRQRSPANPQQNGNPSVTARPNTLTPGRTSETPSRAYAGPTFHASPAASSLPMPKFFSKSVPNLDKSTSLKKMMEPDAPETGSENEESPFTIHNKVESDRRAREESPLDIFFQADRRAKANGNFTAGINGTPGGLHPSDSVRPDASPSRGLSRHHSRHPTDGSTGGVFALEMGGPGPENTNRLPADAQPPVYDRSVSAPSGDMTEEQVREEQRQASTLALKNMLFSPQAQRSSLSSPGPGSSAANLGTASPKARQQRVSPTRDQSRPTPVPGLSSDVSHVQRQAALRALAEKQISSLPGYPTQRPPSSSLRKEMAVPNSPGQPNNHEPPATPTPTHLHGSTPSANTRSQTRARNAAPDNGFLFTQGLQNLALNPKQQHEVAHSGPSPTTAAIENDLRRILKLDVLGGDGAAGVRS